MLSMSCPLPSTHFTNGLALFVVIGFSKHDMWTILANLAIKSGKFGEDANYSPKKICE